jgi:hypothetical protein
MFGNKVVEGMAHSEEFMAIISQVTPLKHYAYNLTPLVGFLDLFIGLALLLNPWITKNNRKQRFLFIWTIFWPFIPASLRYFGGVASFEFAQVLSISLSAALSFWLWRKYTK